MNIADYLLVEAKRLAASRRTSLATIVEDSLRKYLADFRADQERDQSSHPLPLLDGGDPVVGVDFRDTSELWEL